MLNFVRWFLRVHIIKVNWRWQENKLDNKKQTSYYFINFKQTETIKPETKINKTPSAGPHHSITKFKAFIKRKNIHIGVYYFS